MQVTSTLYTIAEYCQQMTDGKIIVNSDYQRSDKVWPVAAKSFLIDTILQGYPIPKLILSQRTDLRTRTTLKEIVDGQQRSKAIYDFYVGRLRLSRSQAYMGLRFEDLDDDIKSTFLSHQLGIDLLVGATDLDIRESFRRMNSYTVPLNSQERLHAVYQGEFKWFVVEMCRQHSEVLKGLMIFSERALSRMDDARLIAEVTAAHLNGIDWASTEKLESVYRKHELSFERERYENLLSSAIDKLLIWRPILEKSLLKTYQVYSLLLAIMHLEDSRTPIEHQVPLDGRAYAPNTSIESSLIDLQAALTSHDIYIDSPVNEFVQASTKSTTKKNERIIRHKWFLKALAGQLND